MFPFIISILLITVIKCEETRREYFIPIALRFDDSLYYNNTDQANFLFVDFQKLSIYNLCYSGPISVTKIDEEGEININVCSDNQSIWISDTKIQFIKIYHFSIFQLQMSIMKNFQMI